MLTNDNFQQFLDAIKIEAVHADRIDRALDTSLGGRFKRDMTRFSRALNPEDRAFLGLEDSAANIKEQGVPKLGGFGESPTSIVSTLLLITAFILVASIPKQWTIVFATVSWFIGLAANVHQALEYLVGSLIVIPFAIAIRAIISRTKAYERVSNSLKTRSTGVTRVTVLSSVVLAALTVALTAEDTFSGSPGSTPIGVFVLFVLVATAIPFVIRQIAYWIYDGFRSKNG